MEVTYPCGASAVGSDDVPRVCPIHGPTCPPASQPAQEPRHQIALLLNKLVLPAAPEVPHA